MSSFLPVVRTQSCHQSTEPDFLAQLTMHDFHPKIVLANGQHIVPLSRQNVDVFAARAGRQWRTGYFGSIIASVAAFVGFMFWCLVFHPQVPLMIGAFLAIGGVIIVALAILLMLGLLNNQQRIRWRQVPWQQYRRPCPLTVIALANQLSNEFGPDAVSVVCAQIDPFLVLTLRGVNPMVVAHWHFGTVSMASK